MSSVIKTSSGDEFIVDSWNHDWLSQFSWRKGTKGYAVTTYREKGKKPTTIRMHRLIMRQFGDMQVDHINNRPSDNRESNLRCCTSAQNGYNKPKQYHNGSSSIYKGVSLNRKLGKYVSSIRKNGKYYYLGLHKSETSAALAYNKKAKELFGEFAWINNIDESKELHGVYGNKNVITKE